MPESSPLEPLARKLLLRGLPAAYVHDTVRELSEHREDLRLEALEEGLSLLDAEAWATRKIGDADHLAAALAAKLQGSSWCGRHPIISFCCLPLVAIIVWWSLFGIVAGWISGVWQWSGNRSSPEPDWPLLQALVKWCLTGAAAMLPVLFCWMALRSFSGFKWAFIACAILSLHHGFQFARLTPPESDGNAMFAVGYSIHADFLSHNAPGFALPWLVFGIFALLQLNSKPNLENQKL